MKKGVVCTKIISLLIDTTKDVLDTTEPGSEYRFDRSRPRQSRVYNVRVQIMMLMKDFPIVNKTTKK